MAGKVRIPVRETVAAVLALLSPVLYFIFSETSWGARSQTMAGHGLLLIALPVGFVLVWLIERRPPSRGRQPTPVWARLLLGAAAGLLLTTALAIVNSLSIHDIQEMPGTSLGTSPESSITASHAAVRLADGRTIHILNAFCGVHSSPVTVSHAKGLLGLDRPLACILPSVRPSLPDSPGDGAK